MLLAEPLMGWILCSGLVLFSCYLWEKYNSLLLRIHGKHKDLNNAYQLLQYREDPDNPPLLVVCDLDRFEVHTNYIGPAKKVYRFNLTGPHSKKLDSAVFPAYGWPNDLNDEQVLGRLLTLTLGRSSA